MLNGRVAARRKIDLIAGFTVAAIFAAVAAQAQTAERTWLRHGYFHGMPPVPMRVLVLGHDPLEDTAANEIVNGVERLWGSSPVLGKGNTGDAILVGTTQQVHAAYPALKLPVTAAAEGYWIAESDAGGKRLLVVAGGSSRGVLYGAFALVRKLATSGWNAKTVLESSPAMPIRWVDEWDNLDGTITRGYGGPSFFFKDGKVLDDLSAVKEYARLLASVGINGCNVNNVNGASPFLTPDLIHGLARIADAMRPWGVRLAISVDIASPQKVGGLKTFDPLDPDVKAWWAAKVDKIYKEIPDFAGFTVKADSEGEPGPASYGRSAADAANVLANALAPHGGVVLYRAFVYNNHLDYNDLKADRARAAYDIFHPLDGQFAPNVIVQIKYGPIDFQAEEPVSPLFAGLKKTNEAAELQITQEYLGQQRHLVYLAPLWKEKLDFDLRAEGRSTPVKEIIEGKSFDRPLGGMVGVSCVGRDWLGAPLAMANLYAFGRLAWNPNLSAEQIAEEWTRQTFINDAEVVATVDKMLMQSWPAYVHYTGFLGTQTLTDITGSHYGPNIEASEENGWGQWHRDDANGIGMDRSVATGTGFAGQYPPELARRYETAATTPEDELLFFHHVPWTYKLHSGKTVIQYVYDIHYQGAEEAARLGQEWATLKGKIDPAFYEDERARLEYQAGHAIVWRDAIVQYFLAESGIPDAHGHAGRFPGRMEAEHARLTGYKIVTVKPWEDASGGKAVTCDPDSAQKNCTAEWTYTGAAGRYNIAVQYFDLRDGVAHFTLGINGTGIVSWAANDNLPSRTLHGDNSTRFTLRGVKLKPGDVLRIEGAPDGSDPAALDYVEIEPAQTAQATHSAEPHP